MRFERKLRDYRMSLPKRRCLAQLLCTALLLFLCSEAQAEQVDTAWHGLTNLFSGKTPHETAVSVYGGASYDWAHTYFEMVSFQRLYDYDSIVPHKSPEGLKVRFEADIGAAQSTEFPGQRVMVSGNFLVVYEFDKPQKNKIVPYIEGGTGLIYTDFRRNDQGLRFLFNPVMGAGLRMGSKFLYVRLHHISNSNLDDKNRGLNSIVLGIGTYL